MRILLIEDDAHVADALELTLRQHGHEVRQLALGIPAVEAACEVDMILLDLGLPDLDGGEVCRRIRRFCAVPIIAVTARGEEIDRVIALRAGADDYIVKPYGVHELLARIEAVARRALALRLDDPDAHRDTMIRVGRLGVDGRSRKAELSGILLQLTRKEFDLLALLAADPGTVHTRESIISQIWDEHWFGSTRTLDVHVGTLRGKLGDPGWIETIRGVGFRLTDPDLK